MVNIDDQMDVNNDPESHDELTVPVAPVDEQLTGADGVAETSEESSSVVEVPSITFESITFSDGTEIALDPSDIIVLVGPNNAGKSLALRELDMHIGPVTTGIVIKSVSLRKRGTVDQLRKLLVQHGRKSGNADNLSYSGFRFNISDTRLEGVWNSRLNEVRQFFCMSIATETRITDSNSVQAIATLDNPPSHPIHILYIDDSIEQRISSYFQRAFGKELIVFHAGGSQWPLLVGERPEMLSGEDRVSGSYGKRLIESTVQLQHQGDGMRSFTSVILHMLAPNTQSILLLDEPEAFLHPSQARLLGEFIAKEKPPNSQLFVATHSADALHGLLNAAPKNLRVLRIQREGEINRVKEMDKTRALAISTDPLMKFSSVMSGVFHQRVIVCESDADCMFYSSILDLPKVHGGQQPDVLFVHSNGKDRLASITESLRALDVTVDVIVDMDVLNDERVLERIVIALGGCWPDIQAQARPLKKAIEQRKSWLTSKEVAKGIRKVLKETPATGEFPKKLRSKINDVFRKASPWDAIKSAGQAAIPAGQATQQYEELQRLCNACGLWIVPVGELECFCKSVGGHGPRWVQRVIEKYDLENSDKLAAARDFMQEIWNRLKPTT